MFIDAKNWNLSVLQKEKLRYKRNFYVFHVNFAEIFFTEVYIFRSCVTNSCTVSGNLYFTKTDQDTYQGKLLSLVATLVSGRTDVTGR